MLFYIGYYYTCTITTVRQEGGPQVSQNVRELLSGLCSQNIPPLAQKAPHYKAGECGTMAWESVWGSGGFGAGLAPCRDGVGGIFRV